MQYKYDIFYQNGRELISKKTHFVKNQPLFSTKDEKICSSRLFW